MHEVRRCDACSSVAVDPVACNCCSAAPLVLLGVSVLLRTELHTALALAPAAGAAAVPGGSGRGTTGLASRAEGNALLQQLLLLVLLPSCVAAAPPACDLAVLGPAELSPLLLMVLRADVSLSQCFPILCSRAMRPMSSFMPLLCAARVRCSLAASISSDKEVAAAILWLTAAV